MFHRVNEKCQFKKLGNLILIDFHGLLRVYNVEKIIEFY